MRRTGLGASHDETWGTVYRDGDGYGDGDSIYTGFGAAGDGELRLSNVASPQLDYEDYEQGSQ